MEQTIVISDLKKDVAQINSSIEEIKKMLGGPKLGNLDRNIYSCFPIANKNDMEKSNELLANPESRENIVRFSFFFFCLISYFSQIFVDCLY